MNIMDLSNYCDDICAQKSFDVCSIDDEFSAKYAFLKLGPDNFGAIFDCKEINLWQQVLVLRVTGIIDRKCGYSGHLHHASKRDFTIFDECFNYISYISAGEFLSEEDLYVFGVNSEEIEIRIDRDDYNKILEIYNTYEYFSDKMH